MFNLTVLKFTLASEPCQVESSSSAVEELLDPTSPLNEQPFAESLVENLADHDEEATPPQVNTPVGASSQPGTTFPSLQP